MSYSLYSRVTSVEAPPIAQAQSWLDPDRFDASVPLIDLSQAVPSYPAPIPVQQTIGRLGGDSSAGFYTDILGIEPLRQAIASEMDATEGDGTDHVSAANVAVTAGCNQAFSVVMQALLAPGDEVIMPLPWYFNHRMYLDMLGATAVGVAPDTSVAADQPHLAGMPSIESLVAHITPRTRAIMIVSPNNPVGTIYPPAYIEALNAVARRHDIALVVDETYRDFITDPDQRHRLFSHPDWHENFIQLYSFSKAFSMTGCRVGSVVAAPELIEQIMKIIDCQTICAPAISQHAALAGLRHCDGFRIEKRALMQTRLQAIRRAFERPGLEFQLLSSGAYFAYIRHPFDLTSTQVAQHLARHHNMLLLPGSMFGPGQDSYLRLAFANVDSDRFETVIDRLELASESVAQNQPDL